MRTLQHLLRAGSLVVAGLALGVSPAWSAEFWLDAQPFVSAEYQPGNPSSAVPMWGYASCDAAWTCGAPTAPGPQLVVPDGNLTIHLRNSLPNTVPAVPNMTSIVIPGQREDGMAPVMFPAEASPHGAGEPDRVRMRSFTHETAQGSTGNYVWSTLKPGTYLYHSGTHAQVQVQMGLYGSVKADAAAGQAYAGQPYSNEATLLFSEVDPALHQAVATGTYGTPPMTSTINFLPKYFLMNGAPYSASTLPIAAGPAGQRVLLRLLNAGLESHVASLLGGHFQVIAEDGNALAHGRDQYETLLPAGKTMDAIWVPAADGVYSLYDRRNRQGMLAKLEVSGTATVPTAVGNAYSTLLNTTLNVPVPGVLANDLNLLPGPTTIVVVTPPVSGTLTLNSDGSFEYIPVAGFFGQVAFTYRVNNGLNDSNVATVTILVNRPPVAVTDAATTQLNQAVTVNVLANDSDPENQQLGITAVTQGTNGTVTFTPTTVLYTNTGATGPDSFTYTISDGQGGTATGTVNVTLNSAPTANNDSYPVAEDVTITVNPRGAGGGGADTDPEGQPLTIIAVTQGTNGGTVTNNGGLSVTYKPALNFNGNDTFTYTISDGQTPTPGTDIGTVTMNVSSVNDRPVAVADAYAVNRLTAFTVPAGSGLLLNDSDADGNTLTALLSTNLSGTVTLNANGSFTYTTTVGYVGTRIFKYRVTDGSLQSTVVNVTLTKELTVSSIVNNNNNGNPIWIIRGRSTTPGSTVTVHSNGTLGGPALGTVPVDGTGNWRLNVPRTGANVSLAPFISVSSSTGAQLIEVPAP